MYKAKKSYGQHFLINENLAESIANSLKKSEDTKNVLEVGPGKGVLTKYLLKQEVSLKAIEADRDMVQYLNENFELEEDQVIQFDFLKADLNRVFDGKSFRLIGNFPYNISSQILFKMVDNRTLIPEMVGMFQKEVADRVVAKPGSKTYGVLSVLIQAFYTGKVIFNVSKGSFSPPPKVNSAAIQLFRREENVLHCDYPLFRHVVKTTFGQRRKMIRNTLKHICPRVDELEKELLKKRPEQLSLNDFVILTQKIEQLK